MKALVATVNYLLFVDLQSGQVKIVESNRPEYYGISWWENSDTLVLSHSGLANDSLVDIEKYIHSEKGYLSFADQHSTPFLSQPHQLLCAPNQWIIVTNTGRNCITLYDPTHGFYKDIRINDIYWDRLGKDNLCGEHFNSVYLKNDRLYVLAHRFTKNSRVLEFSYPDCTLLNQYDLQKRSGLHNIWVDDAGNIITCHSDAGELIEVKSNEILWATNACNYSRGLAVTEDSMIIGDSEVTVRENRKNSLSVLWIIDRKTLNTLDCLTLGPYGAVHEVRLLDMRDEAHHGHLFAGLSTLENQLAAAEEYLAERNPAKLHSGRNTREHRHLLQLFQCVLNSWFIDESGWFTAKKESLTLGMLRESLQEHFSVTFDYTFPKSDLSPQHISLVIGYQGPYDTNMLAILVNYENQKTTVHLWQHSKGSWKRKKILIRNAPQTGTLSVTRKQNQLSVECGSASILLKRLTAAELNGGLGIRSHGGQFRNFIVNKNIPADEIKTFRQHLKRMLGVC